MKEFGFLRWVQSQKEGSSPLGHSLTTPGVPAASLKVSPALKGQKAGSHSGGQPGPELLKQLLAARQVGSRAGSDSNLRRGPFASAIRRQSSGSRTTSAQSPEVVVVTPVQQEDIIEAHTTARPVHSSNIPATFTSSSASMLTSGLLNISTTPKVRRRRPCDPREKGTQRTAHFGPKRFAYRTTAPSSVTSTISP